MISCGGQRHWALYNSLPKRERRASLLAGLLVEMISSALIAVRMTS